jgi:ABC-type transport system involved in multi-copper enzyme maturation permease subunit
VPIYDQAYKPWEGTLVPKPKTWWVIARTGVRLLWQKWLIVLLIFSSFPFAVRAVQIYINSRMGEDSKLESLAKQLEINAGFFEGFLKGQSFLLILVLVIAGAGLIARDREFRALSLYFSRPVDFWDYVGGKFLVLAFYAGLITLAPALLLFVIQLFLTSDATFIKEYFWIPFAVTGAFAVTIAVLGSLMLAVSAIAGSRSAAILFFAVIWFPEIMRNILTRIPSVGYYSVSADLRQILSLFLGTERPYEFSPVGAAVALVVFLVVSIAVLKLRIRPTEVVK